MQKTVLILGATGRIGRHTEAAFSGAGWAVRKFNRSADDLRSAAAGADVIVNGWNPPYNRWQAELPGQTRALIDQGVLPWFTDSELRLRFWRPLSSATLALDHLLFGRSHALAHLHSLAWMAVLTGAAARLYRRWFARGAAAWCSAIFALSAVHAVPTVWLAARHTLVAAAFGALALLAWLRFREERVPRARALALAALLGSLMSSESGLGAAALVTSYELSSRGLRRGLYGASPVLFLSASYLLAYTLCGYGARASGLYVSPFDSPFDYAGAVLTRMPPLVVELFVGLPSLAAGLGGDPLRLVYASLALGACAAYTELWSRLGKRISQPAKKTLKWLTFGTLASLLGLVGAPVSGRVLPLPMLGAAAVIGNALWAALAAAQQPKPARHGAFALATRGGGRRWWFAVGALALLHLGLSPLLRVGLPFQFMKVNEEQRQVALRADVGECARGGSLYLLSGSDPSLALFGLSALRFYAPRKAGAERFRVLSMAPEPQVLTRLARRTLQLQVLGGPRQPSAFERLFRTERHPLEVGGNVDLPELSVRVEGASQGLFTRASFEFTPSPAGPPECFVVWRDRRLQPLPLPRVGHSVRIAHEPGPVGL